MGGVRGGVPPVGSHGGGGRGPRQGCVCVFGRPHMRPADPPRGQHVTPQLPSRQRTGTLSSAVVAPCRHVHTPNGRVNGQPLRTSSICVPLVSLHPLSLPSTSWAPAVPVAVVAQLLPDVVVVIGHHRGTLRAVTALCCSDFAEACKPKPNSYTHRVVPGCGATGITSFALLPWEQGRLLEAKLPSA
jgi:hypothetical protein